MHTENTLVSKSIALSNHKEQLNLKNEVFDKIDTIQVSQPEPQYTNTNKQQIDCDESSSFASIFGKLMLAFVGGILLSDGLFIRIGAL